jgi:AcrR family transcriptional regulator
MQMVNPAKAQKNAATNKRPRLRQAEAEVRMKNATAQLLLAHHPADVTVHMISAAAGVHHDYVARYFGSREELMIQTIESAVLGTVLAADDSGKTDPVSTIDSNEKMMAMVNARLRTMSYLLACGVSAERFSENQKMINGFGFSQFTNPNLTDRTKMNFTLMAVLLVQAMTILGEVHEMTELQKSDIRSAIANFGLITEQIQTELKWDQPVPKKRK